MNKVLAQLNPDGIILLFALILANLRASIFVYLYPDPSILIGPAWISIALWLLIVFVMLYYLVRNNQMREYLWKWRRVWFVATFLLLAMVSAFWSVDPLVTIFRSLELLFATLIAAYLAMRYRPSQLMEILFWFGAILLIITIAVVVSAPKTGTMYWQPFDGAWRGVYWHRNHLGSVAALLNMIFLCRTLFAFEKRNPTGFVDGCFYVLSLTVLYFAESVTAYILFILLNFLVFCGWIWFKVHHRLRTGHYYAIAGIFGAGLVLVLANLDLVFGLFNRNTTLTGRVGLWNYLLNEIVPRRPWWGHGFGAFWTIDSFREEVRQHIGWPSQPLIADNGFLDILLHLGVMGVAILLLVVLAASVQSIRYAILRKSLPDSFPLFFMSYALIGNIPFSLLAETEVFVWLLIVAILFMTMPDSGQAMKRTDEVTLNQKPKDVNHLVFIKR